ncbi:MAG: hypothetical protein ACKV2T_41655 [Kofleriaceae bacterium]
MRWMLLAIAMLGCGSGSTATEKPKKPECLDCGPGGIHGEGPLNEEAVRTQLCERANTHASAGCSPFDRLDPKLLATCGVVTSFQLAGMEDCLLETTCDLMSACFTKARATDYPPAYKGPTRACVLRQDHEDLGYPAGVTREEMLASYGASARTYADVPSTKDKPIEVCGFPAAGAWLARMTCKDGSYPLPTRADAERVRVGNVGEGGRCGRIIDRYQVECPEMTYDIFIDAYRCQR